LLERLIVFGALALCAGLSIVHATAAAPVTGAVDTTRYEAAPPPQRGAEVVYLGVEPIQSYNVDLTKDTFQTSFYIWWRWKGPIDPSSTTDVVNSTNSSSAFAVQYSYLNSAGAESPTRLRDGYEYQTAKISTGVSDPFSVARYPLDSHDLTVRIENNTYDEAQLVYVPDTANLTAHPNATVAGWGVGATSMRTYLHQYGTNFGVLDQGTAASQYSQITYTTAITRPISHCLMKLLLPLLIVFLTTLALLFIKFDEYDAVPATAIVGLLTLVFLQQNYSIDLPPTVPQVLLDEIYCVAYLALAVAFGRTIWVMNQVHHHEKGHEDFIVSNRRFSLAIAAAFAAAVLGLVFA
jgi:hypothetical protein